MVDDCEIVTDSDKRMRALLLTALKLSTKCPLDKNCGTCYMQLSQYTCGMVAIRCFIENTQFRRE